MLDDIPAIDINSDEAKLLFLEGKGIYKEDMKDKGKFVYITSKGKPIALAKIEDKYIFPFRVFNN